MTSSSARVLLVVDDEPLLRLVASSALEDEGSTVYVAGDSDQALDEVARHPEIELLFTDVNMPGSRNGIALAEEAIARRPDLKLIVTSGRQVVSDDKLPDHGTFCRSHTRSPPSSILWRRNSMVMLRYKPVEN